MQILLLCDTGRENEFLPELPAGKLRWVTGTSVDAWQAETADVCIDLRDIETGWAPEWTALPWRLLVVNSVLTTLADLPPNAVRINAWPGFTAREIVEAAAPVEMQQLAGELFTALGKKTSWTPDLVGFVSLRIVASMINEAYFALEETVSSREEIDLAMKTGTNYPYGPFEWAEKIGKKKLLTLLSTLAASEERYTPARLLQQEGQIP